MTPEDHTDVTPKDVGQVDAWRQLMDLHERFTEEHTPRPDLKVVAHGLDRSVELCLGDRRRGRLGSLMWFWDKTTGPRNVGTMRELAAAINAACDFVEQSNPKWAENGT